MARWRFVSPLTEVEGGQAADARVARANWGGKVWVLLRDDYPGRHAFRAFARRLV
ncbi:hypothetical protein [Pedosphaera parvula]|uniref:hypothetical protein n=1 Tax=Pedosphaera parvula TaxID=1032527 RepID=UPI0002E605B0|nr:hypothetical protein [Pedosphaera parvula]